MGIQFLFFIATLIPLNFQWSFFIIYDSGFKEQQTNSFSNNNVAVG